MGRYTADDGRYQPSMNASARWRGSGVSLWKLVPLSEGPWEEGISSLLLLWIWQPPSFFFFFSFFLWSDRSRVDYFVTLRRLSRANSNNNNCFDYCSLEAPDTNVSMVLSSVTSWGGPFRALVVLDRNAGMSTFQWTETCSEIMPQFWRRVGGGGGGGGGGGERGSVQSPEE